VLLPRSCIVNRRPVRAAHSAGHPKAAWSRPMPLVPSAILGLIVVGVVPPVIQAVLHSALPDCALPAAVVLRRVKCPAVHLKPTSAM
jgi:hypothetical protein